MRNCSIDEKHLALSLMNQDRKMFLQSHNDKFRSRLSKEKNDFKVTQTGDKNYYGQL